MDSPNRLKAPEDRKDSTSISKMTEITTAHDSRGLGGIETDEAEGKWSPQSDTAGSTLATESDASAKNEAALIAPVASTPRISYNNGYGDFCFGRLVKRKRSPSEMWYPKTKKEELEEDLATGSQGAPVAEPGNFFLEKEFFDYLISLWKFDNVLSVFSSNHSSVVAPVHAVNYTNNI